MLNNHTISFPFGPGDLLTKIAYSSGLPLYMGRATPGASDAAAEWQIRKITYDAAGNITAIQWAGGVKLVQMSCILFAHQFGVI